ncbi:hypothetical protein O6H91_07G120500 [Diphasiastrum complanatum]|uniref:Uncharacterized protein n=1 Tax=Diphasiastrum complanatum TaxID=34168 RepID=A0ACC2D9A4_DIPCM|nr:hypothetical protein O6H91_07G120500 [Diphasiastrum complanatum]
MILSQCFSVTGDGKGLCGSAVWQSRQDFNFANQFRGRMNRHFFAMPRLEICKTFPDGFSRKGLCKVRGGMSVEDWAVSENDVLKETIFQLEKMLKEPGEVLGGMQDRLSIQDLQLLLTYFAQEGHDSWCALEVYEWMQRMDKAGNETRSLMMSIMLNWMMKLVEQKQPVQEVSSLLKDMQCVGLKPEFHMIRAIISSYWEKGKKAEAECFVEDLLGCELEWEREDPVAFLVLKMAMHGEQKEALKFVSKLRESGFNLKVSAYNAALLAAVVEQEQLTRTRSQLEAYEAKGFIAQLDQKDLEALEDYENRLHKETEKIANWALEEELPETMPSIYERLLAMYCIAGKWLKAEQNMWQMKLAGREPAPEMYNIIAGICALQNQPDAAYNIIRRMEASGRMATKKTYSVLVGAFVKGGNYEEACKAMQQMLDRGFLPEGKEMLVVLRCLQKAGFVILSLDLCKRLAQVGITESCMLYMYIGNFCIIKMV